MGIWLFFEMKKMKKIIISVVVLLLISACSDSDIESAKYTDEYLTTKKVEYTLQLKNNTNRELKKAMVLLYAPVDKTSSQKTIKLSISKPHKVNKDSVGNQIITVPFEHVVIEKEEQITLQAELQMATEPNLIQQANIDLFKNISRVLATEDKEIFDSVVKQVQTNETLETLQNIAQWVEENLAINDDEQAEMFDPSTVAATVEQIIDMGSFSLLNKKGSVNGNANMILDLAKASNIPVRWVVGLSVTESNEIKLENAQLWLQYVSAGKWHLFDATTKKEIKDYSEKVILRIFPEYIDLNFVKPEQLLYETIGFDKV